MNTMLRINRYLWPSTFKMYIAIFHDSIFRTNVKETSQFSQTILNILHYYGNVLAEILFLSTRIKECHLIHASIRHFLCQDHESLHLAPHYFNCFCIVSLKSYFFEYLFVYLIVPDLLRISHYLWATRRRHTTLHNGTFDGDKFKGLRMSRGYK